MSSTAVIRRNGLVVIPSGSRFCPAGTAPDPMPKMATNTLGYSQHVQGVLDVGGGLVRSPQGIYLTLAEDALDEGGTTYAKGTVLYIPPDVPVQLAAKSAAGPGKTGTVIIYDANPYPTSAKAMASGMAMVGSAFILAWVLFG